MGGLLFGAGGRWSRKLVYSTAYNGFVFLGGLCREEVLAVGVSFYLL